MDDSDNLGPSTQQKEKSNGINTFRSDRLMHLDEHPAPIVSSDNSPSSGKREITKTETKGSSQRHSSEHSLKNSGNSLRNSGSSRDPNQRRPTSPLIDFNEVPAYDSHHEIPIDWFSCVSTPIVNSQPDPDLNQKYQEEIKQLTVTVLYRVHSFFASFSFVQFFPFSISFVLNNVP